MKKQEIEVLLNRYYEGTTSLAEENQLRIFFRDDQACSDYQAEKELFQWLDDSRGQEVSVPADLEQRLSDAIDNRARTSRDSSVFKKRFALLAGMAASVLLFIGIARFHAVSSLPVDTYTQPEEAALEAQKVLHLFAQTLERGEQGFRQAQDVTQDIRTQLSSFKTFKK